MLWCPARQPPSRHSHSTTHQNATPLPGKAVTDPTQGCPWSVPILCLRRPPNLSQGGPGKQRPPAESWEHHGEQPRWRSGMGTSHRRRCVGQSPVLPRCLLVREVMGDAARPLPRWSPAPLWGQVCLLCLSSHPTAGVGLLGYEAAACPIGFHCDWHMKQPLGKLFASIFGLGTFLIIFGAAGAGAGGAQALGH